LSKNTVALVTSATVS